MAPNDKIQFYSVPNTADGSLILQSKQAIPKVVDAVTLGDHMQGKRISHPIILKVEAEGAEPEVLIGAKNFFEKCDIVTVDCGNARGKHTANTFVEINNI